MNTHLLSVAGRVKYLYKLSESYLINVLNVLLNYFQLMAY